MLKTETTLQLTPTMKVLLRHIQAGKTTRKELAEAMGQSEEVVKIYMHRLYERMKIPNKGFKMPKLIQWLHEHPLEKEKEK